MPYKKDKKPSEPIRRIAPRASREVGPFLLVIALIIGTLGYMYITGNLSNLMLLIGAVAILALVYTQSPPLIIQLNEYERAVILRYGKFLKVDGPGWVVLIPFIDEPYVVDMRVSIVDIHPQDVVTKDKIKLKIDAIIFMRIKDPKAAVLNIENAKLAVADYIKAHLRDVVGKMELESVISQVNMINDLLHKGLDRVSQDWGIDTVKVEIQSVELPHELMTTMHQRKEAEQKKFAAEEDAKAHQIRIDAVAKAAGKLSDPALQYLYLQALEKVAAGRSSKIIFPLELTHLAERLGGRVTQHDMRKIEDDLRGKYDEFVLEETRDGIPIDTKDILTELKNRASEGTFRRKKK